MELGVKDWHWSLSWPLDIAMNVPLGTPMNVLLDAPKNGQMNVAMSSCIVA